MLHKTGYTFQLLVSGPPLGPARELADQKNQHQAIGYEEEREVDAGGCLEELGLQLPVVGGY